LKNKKLPTRLKNKTWTNPQIKNCKKIHELKLIKPLQNTSIENS
jgi:hypothetical protein